MNSLANPIEEQGDPTWPAESWDPPVATICSGALETRHFHPSRQEWDWAEHQAILGAHYSTADQDVECKPNVIQVDAVGGSAGLRHYNGVLHSSLPSISPSNSWGMLNAAGMRQNVGMESSSANFPTSSSSFYGGLGSSGGLSGYGTCVNNYLGEPRTSVEQRHLLGLVSLDHRRLHDLVKRGLYSTPDFNARIGLNLGGRTYFSTEDSTMARFGKRFRPNSPGAHVPMCQAEGCKADLSLSKHYHRRHKVCEYHSKAATVMITGKTQRFCQQCSRFHALSEFDEGKRSCRKRLADHNRRRRKPQPNSSTTTSSTGDLTPKPSDEDGSAAPGQTQNTAGQKEGLGSSDQAQSLLSGISLTPSVSLSLQHEKNQVPALTDENNEKQTYQPFLQSCLSGPSLSLSTLGGGNQSQSSGQSFANVDLSVPWLRSVGSRMNLMENVGRSGLGSHQAVNESNCSPNGHLLEHGSRVVPENVQNLLPQSCSGDMVVKPEWAMDSIPERSQEMHTVNSGMLAKSEGQTVLSLLEGGGVETDVENQNHRSSLGYLQHHLSSSANVNESSDILSVSENLHEASKFQGVQMLRPINESIYATSDFFIKDGLV